jgi:hypothetical protein
MKITIYAIGGNLNDKVVGCAHDPITGASLLDFIENQGGYACSLHGPVAADGQVVSGEYLLNDARNLFQSALDRQLSS